jgi:hypothetical protein
MEWHTMKGQWFGRYESDGANGKTFGALLIDIDEMDDGYAGYAIIQNDQANLPIVFTRVFTKDRAKTQKLSLNLSCLDPRTFDPVDWKQIQSLYPGVTLASNVDATITCQNGMLDLQWASAQTGQTGKATIPESHAGRASVLVAKKLDNWGQFKEAVQTLPPHKFAFRGQQSNVWRLRTSFHRAGRANLERYALQDIPAVSKNLSGLTKHLFNLAEPLQYGAFVSLIQHHGYPTPLLDWTHSPYVAAFFAYRGLRARAESDKFVRIFKFDVKRWSKLPQWAKLGILPPHISILDALAVENNRMLPQQALSTITNIDDIESFVQRQEETSHETFLEAFDIPASERQVVSRDLEMMGIGAGSLLPGLDGACEQLKERHFPV